MNARTSAFMLVTLSCMIHWCVCMEAAECSLHSLASPMMLGTVGGDSSSPLDCNRQGKTEDLLLLANILLGVSLVFSGQNWQGGQGLLPCLQF